MMERSYSAEEESLDLVETVFSWILKDVLNDEHCKQEVVFPFLFNVQHVKAH